MHALLDVRIDNYDVTEFQLSHVVEDLLATCLFMTFILYLMTSNKSLFYFLSEKYLVFLPVVSKTPSVWLHGRTLARDYRYRQSKSSMVALANWTTMFQSSNHYSRQNTFHDPYRLSSHRASFIFHGFLRLHWRNSSTILHRKTVSSNYVHVTLIGIG